MFFMQERNITLKYNMHFAVAKLQALITHNNQTHVLYTYLALTQKWWESK